MSLIVIIVIIFINIASCQVPAPPVASGKDFCLFFVCFRFDNSLLIIINYLNWDLNCSDLKEKTFYSTFGKRHFTLFFFFFSLIIEFSNFKFEYFDYFCLIDFIFYNF
jgi:hypothetical protein